MDYLTLLRKLENHLRTLQIMDIRYLNIESIKNYDIKNILVNLKIISKDNKLNPERYNLKEPISEEINYSKINFTTKKNTNEIKHNKEILDKKEFLNNLFQKYQSCLKCELGKTRKNIVFGKGYSESKIMFIGEGPGADEDEIGEPFVGRAGKLLMKMINSIGIESQDVYITNIVKCRPPNNRNPLEIEIKSCFPILKKQIEIINPKLIITLGNVAAKSLIPDIPGITKIHGKVLQYENWKMLPTFHPSYLLRNRSSMSLAWQDFKSITELAF